MSELITDIDIKNWRWHYSSIPLHEMKGVDLFVLSCLSTIEKLTAELAAMTAERDRLADKVEDIEGRWNKIIGETTINMGLLSDNDTLRAERDSQQRVCIKAMGELAEERKQRGILEELYNSQQETMRGLWEQNETLTARNHELER
jgi:hypothetical protein